MPDLVLAFFDGYGGSVNMGKHLLSCLALAAIFVFAAPALAAGGCGGTVTAHGGSLEVADASTPSGPVTPTPPQPEK